MEGEPCLESHTTGLGVLGLRLQMFRVYLSNIISLKSLLVSPSVGRAGILLLDTVDSLIMHKCISFPSVHAVCGVCVQSGARGSPELPCSLINHLIT